MNVDGNGRVVRIDLGSDTKTRPSAAMRAAMAAAEVGDEQSDEDPTTNALQERMADLMGKEAGLFVPSGTMCNQIALAVHCRPGDEYFADRTAHITNFESGGSAVNARVQPVPIDGARGIFTADQLKAAIRKPMRHSPLQTLVVIEQTSNMGSGSVWPLATINEVAEVARAHKMKLHMDGARLLNAQVASGIAAKTFAASIDSVWIDLSKGLGCPVGGVLAGTKEFIEDSWRWKQRFGGSMRQSGILAAAGIYALDNNVERMAEDHANARAFASVLAQVPSIAIRPEEIETNIIIFDVAETGWKAGDLTRRLLDDEGIRMGAQSDSRIRAVTHLDVDRAMVMEAAEKVAQLCRKGPH
jgi:threonine aldolase